MQDGLTVRNSAKACYWRKGKKFGKTGILYTRIMLWEKSF